LHRARRWSGRVHGKTGCLPVSGSGSLASRPSRPGAHKRETARPSAHLRRSACDAAKIRCLSRRTSSSACRLSTPRQPATSPSGPFTMPAPHAPACTSAAMASNLPFGSGVLGHQSLRRPTRLTSAHFRVRAPAPYPAGYPRSAAEVRRPRPGFPAAFRHAGVGFLSRPAPARDLRLPHGRPTRHQVPGTRTGWSRSARTRCDRKGCPLYPGDDGAPAAATQIGGRRLPHRNGMSLNPGTARHLSGPNVTRRQQGLTGVHPPGLPLTCNPRMARRSLGFPRSSAPRRYQQRTSGQGQA